jgi:hypothetical protein
VLAQQRLGRQLDVLDALLLVYLIGHGLPASEGIGTCEDDRAPVADERTLSTEIVCLGRMPTSSRGCNRPEPEFQ